ncbi:ABC transporter permease [Humidisolicoccus flavus]|uniref:ABC transporter permease n=1 Tax=Humidisolicoccus flavus TaxID=3111414 RepID=UPI00324529D4
MSTMTQSLATISGTKRRNQRRMTGSAIAYSSVGLLGFLAIWWIGSTFVGDSALASPIEVIARLGQLMVEPLAGQTLPGHALASLHKWAGGFCLAVLIGLPLGCAFGWFPSFRSALLPIFEVLRYIPPFAWIPLTILWFGAGYTAQAAVVFIAVLPPVLMNAELGIRQLDPLLYRASRVLGASRSRTLLETAIPSSSPSAVTGLRIGIGNGWMALMGAELIVGRSGLGYVILSGQQSNDAATVMAGMVAIGLLGFAMDRAMQLITSPLTRWRKGLEEL